MANTLRTIHAVGRGELGRVSVRIPLTNLKGLVTAEPLFQNLL